MPGARYFGHETTLIGKSELRSEIGFDALHGGLLDLLSAELHVGRFGLGIARSHRCRDPRASRGRRRGGSGRPPRGQVLPATWPMPCIPLYNGTAWFLPFAGACYRTPAVSADLAGNRLQGDTRYEHLRRPAAVPKGFHRRRVAGRGAGRSARRRRPGDRRGRCVEVADAAPEDATAALDAAVAAQAAWAATPPRERGEILRRAFDIIMARTDELALLMTLEMGKPLAEAKGEVAYAAEFFRWFSEEAVRIDGGYAARPDGTSRILVSASRSAPAC